MSKVILIMGQPSTGKSYSFKNLNPKETFILSTMDKDLPFSGSMKNYTIFSSSNLEGNYKSTLKYSIIHDVIAYVNSKRQEIKHFIIDDFQYLMFSEFVDKAQERGYDKFSIMASNAWRLLESLSTCRQDLTFYITWHSDEGGFQVKTCGKMLSEKTSIEGIFSMILHSVYNDGEYKFLTQREDTLLAKTPEGLFKEKFISNDLKYVYTEWAEFRKKQSHPDFNEEEIHG